MSIPETDSDYSISSFTHTCSPIEDVCKTPNHTVVGSDHLGAMENTSKPLPCGHHRKLTAGLILCLFFNIALTACLAYDMYFTSRNFDNQNQLIGRLSEEMQSLRQVSKTHWAKLGAPD